MGHIYENGVSMDTVLFRVHVTAIDDAVEHNIYVAPLGVHLCCVICHESCNNVCQENLEQHISGHLTDHSIVMHILLHHHQAQAYALWHNSMIRTFDFIGENGLLEFIHSRNGNL